MKITCPTESLCQTLRLTAKGVKKTSPIPVLQHVKIETDESIGVRLTATDYELEMSCTTGAKIDAPGAVTLPARQFMEIVNATSGKEITLEADEQSTVLLKSGRSRWRLAGIAASGFPALPMTGETLSGILPQWRLKQALSLVAHAIARDDSRPAMTGALLRFRDNQLQLVATDSYRLAIASIDFPDPGVPDYQAIIPARTVKELIPFLLGDAEEEILFAADENQIEFKTPFYTVKSRLLAGTFPAVDRIITLTQENRHAVTVPRLLLIEVLKRAEILAREDLHRVRVQITVETLGIYASAISLGDSGEELEITQSWAPETMTIWLRTDQLLEALQEFETEHVTLGYENPQRPLLLYPGEAPYFEIVMPLCPPAEG